MVSENYLLHIAYNYNPVKTHNIHTKIEVNGSNIIE